jgi:hypothetical protein
MSHPKLPPSLPTVIDEAGDSPSWVPALGFGLFAAVAIVVAIRLAVPGTPAAGAADGADAADGNGATGANANGAEAADPAADGVHAAVAPQP